MDNKKYIVHLSATYGKDIEITATSENEACDIAQEMVSNEEITFNDNDFATVFTEVISKS